MDAKIQVPTPKNEPVFSYSPSSEDRKQLQAALANVTSEKAEIPCIIGGKRIFTGNKQPVVMPHNHQHTLAEFHAAGPKEVQAAMVAAKNARKQWSSMPWESRMAVFLRAAELLSSRYRMRTNAVTMLGQSKTCHQSEIDSVCELVDFYKFNSKFAQNLYERQPISSAGLWNQSELRPLEGFVLAVSPFNFTSIAVNLAAAPAMMGNTVLWKPSEPQTFAAYDSYLLLEEAGLPPGVINFLPGSGPDITSLAMQSPGFAGLHFTGSTDVFRMLWQKAASQLTTYRNYPRLVGETGGKDFVVAHPSCDPDALVAGLIRGAFEYQGQKCSAASRAYIAESVWKKIEKTFLESVREVTMGDVSDFSNFMGAVITKRAFDRHTDFLQLTKTDTTRKLLCGGETDDSVGYFVRPTVVQTTDPKSVGMTTELFAPILHVYVYPDAEFTQTLQLVDTTSNYALTGAIFANDRQAINQALARLRYAAGNFYINDKPTGAVVGQQPFGGSRGSGTNDRAGSEVHLTRWVTARTIKENLQPPMDYRYDFLGEEKR